MGEEVEFGDAVPDLGCGGELVSLVAVYILVEEVDRPSTG